MKRFWFNFLARILTIGGILFFMLASLPDRQVVAQGETPPPGVFITVTYNEQINVRAGPSTVLYDIIGNLQPGETAPALGVSPGRDWVQIAFPAGPGGIGWVYADLVTLSAGNLNVVEPPPTATPRVTATIDPTLAAAYAFEPTSTRLPTFTPPPPINTLVFETPPATADSGLPMAALILGLGIPGLLGLLVSLLRR
ncbi:MAG: hypothetical protein Kow002_12210 [Anaerolineales bacterium]